MLGLMNGTRSPYFAIFLTPFFFSDYEGSARLNQNKESEILLTELLDAAQRKVPVSSSHNRAATPRTSPRLGVSADSTSNETQHPPSSCRSSSPSPTLSSYDEVRQHACRRRRRVLRWQTLSSADLSSTDPSTRHRHRSAFSPPTLLRPGRRVADGPSKTELAHGAHALVGMEHRK